MSFVCFCFFKQKTAYEMRISDWSSDVCSSDLGLGIVAYHGARDPEQALVAALHELAERTALAAPCQCHQLGVGQGGPGDCFGGGAIGHGKLLCHQSDAAARERFPLAGPALRRAGASGPARVQVSRPVAFRPSRLPPPAAPAPRSEGHTSELQSLMR